MCKHQAMAEETGEPRRTSLVLAWPENKGKRCMNILSKFENLPESLFVLEIKPHAANADGAGQCWPARTSDV
jgi:hypothetical protein